MTDEKFSPLGTPGFPLAIALLAQQVLGALTFPVARYGLREIDPYTFAFFRFVISSLVLLFLARIRRSSPAIDKKDYRKIFLLGAIIIPFNQTTYLVGQSLTAAGHGALLFATVPIWLFVAALVFLKEKFVLRRGIGVAIGLLGVLLIMGGGAIEFSSRYLWGDLIILVSVLAWVSYTILGKPLVIKYGALRVTAYALSFGTLLYLPFGLYRALSFDYTGVSTGAWLSVLYVALGVSVVAYVLWYWLLKHLAASRLAVFNNIQPVIASLAAWVFLGEPIGLSFIIGGLVVLTGVLVTTAWGGVLFSRRNYGMQD